jgi:hypothetical protein
MVCDYAPPKKPPFEFSQKTEPSGDAMPKPTLCPKYTRRKVGFDKVVAHIERPVGGQRDMFILKLAAVTCVVYLGISLMLFLGGLALVYWKGIVGYSHSFLAWAVLFGLVWLVSFFAAWSIVCRQVGPTISAS